jgi:hypothetical protein
MAADFAHMFEFSQASSFIGTDGGGEAYAFDISKSDPAVLKVSIIGLPSDARMVASSFDSFVSGAVV